MNVDELELDLLPLVEPLDVLFAPSVLSTSDDGGGYLGGAGCWIPGGGGTPLPLGSLWLAPREESRPGRKESLLISLDVLGLGALEAARCSVARLAERERVRAA